MDRAGVNMHQAQAEVSKEQLEASLQFGRIIHYCAVRAGGKSQLAIRAGFVSKEAVEKAETAAERECICAPGKMVIKLITIGKAYELNVSVLLGVARAVTDVVHRDDCRRLGMLIDQITGSEFATTVERPGPLPYRERL